MAPLRKLFDATVEAFRELSLLTYASAIAFRALVALIPLTLLGLALLGALGLEDVWRDPMAPAVEKRATAPVYRAIDASVRRIFGSGDVGLIALASGLALWHLTMAMRVATVALNKIHGQEESRPFVRRIATSIALAFATAACLIGSVLVLVVAPRLGGEGLARFVLATGRWAVAVALLGLAIALVVRYAPAEHPEPRWASAGSALVVVTWVVASLAFRWYVGSVANFESASGMLTVFLVLTAYVFTTSAIFVMGVQVDEVLRKQRA